MNKEQVLIYNFDKLAEQFKKKEFERVAKENQKYKEVIDKAIKKMQLLIVISYDYDGFNQVDSLKNINRRISRLCKRKLEYFKRGERR